MEAEMQVAIDGPAGAGKSTAARALAQALGYIYIDTGAMYRAVAWQAGALGLALSDTPALAALAGTIKITFQAAGEYQRVWVGDTEVTAAIRTPEISHKVPAVAAIPAVRQALVQQQQALARARDVVMEGRDIGSIVLPRAECKFFVTASLKIRAERRALELRRQGFTVDQAALEQEIELRDRQDEERTVGALKILPDFIIIDTSDLTIEAVVARMAAIVTARNHQGE
jgi:cytidylate kinase